ncbi:hypothetical protein ARAM_007588 [Aspergillus rambellii]|uniref:Thioredoxin domain-containing protein n=1 Tax=Aspergillus rambellii TaxID=308745 RepID=A0A0F8UGC5_9EURO|nr:hypothetical protein ARAM_007588 [Aspergillus rambellii]
MGGLESIKSKAEFDAKVLSKDAGPVVVDCFATWCGPCKAIAPKVEEFSNTYPDAKFYQIDVDELSEVAAELGDGEKVTEVVGANPPAIEAAVKSLIA